MKKFYVRILLNSHPDFRFAKIQLISIKQELINKKFYVLLIGRKTMVYTIFMGQTEPFINYSVRQSAIGCRLDYLLPGNK